MNTTRRDDPGRRRRLRRCGWSGTFVALLLASALGHGADAARADVCSECREPSRSELERDPRFVLEDRGGVRDYVQVDGGECRLRLDGLGPLKRTASWLVLRGLGEVWNCPSTTSCDTVTVGVTEDDAKSWTLTGTVTASAKVLGIGLGASLAKSVSEAVRLSQVTTISKYLCAPPCRRIFWQAWFEVDDYRIDAYYTVQRRYAWWTKNWLVEGIHAKGNVWVDCTTGVAELQARSPVSGHWRLRQRGCDDPECGVVPVVDLGWFPRPRQGLRLFPPESEAPVPDEYRLPPVPTGPEDGGDDGAAEPEAPPTALPSEPRDDEPAGDPPPPSSDLGDPPTGPLPDPLAESQP